MSVVGQLCVSVKVQGAWEYTVITDIFDDRYITINKNGRRTLIYHETERLVRQNVKEVEEVVKTEGYTEPLFKDGEPVIVKKNIFGKYKIPKINK